MNLDLLALNPQPPAPEFVHGASPTSAPAFQPRDITINSTVEYIANLTEGKFSVAFKGSVVKRAKWRGLKRNAEAALQIPNAVFAVAPTNKGGCNG